MTPSQKNEKALAALEHIKNDLEDIYESRALPAPILAKRSLEWVNEAIAALSQPTMADEVDLGDWSEVIEADGTDENGRNIRESWVLNVEAEEALYQLSPQMPQSPLGGEVVTVEEMAAVATHVLSGDIALCAYHGGRVAQAIHALIQSRVGVR